MTKLAIDAVSKLGMIGFGKMGEILAKAATNVFLVDHITVSSPRLLQGIKQTVFPVAESNYAAAKNANFVLLATKPELIPKVCEEIASAINHHTVIISIAAGVTIQTILHHIGKPDIPVVRAMPNTPLLINCGITPFFANQFVTSDQKQKITHLFQSAGDVIELSDEQQLDSATALSGSGPAYFFYIQEIMIDHAINVFGLTPKDAHQLVTKTMLGAAQLTTNSQLSLGAQRAQVTSPNGTTAAAIARFDELNLKQVITEGLNAALKRAQELSEPKE